MDCCTIKLNASFYNMYLLSTGVHIHHLFMLYMNSKDNVNGAEHLVFFGKAKKREVQLKIKVAVGVKINRKPCLTS